MTDKNFQYSVYLPATAPTGISMRIMCVDMAEVADNIKRLGADTIYAIEEKMDGPFLTHQDLGRE